jgi:hypothetical protein
MRMGGCAAALYAGGRRAGGVRLRLDAAVDEEAR